MSFHIDHICFAYERHEVLRGLSLTLESGHFYGIVGPNGCGKTTFIDLLMGHSSPSQGFIFYKDQDILSYPKKELAKEMALVPQNFYINFPFSAEEVVMMGRYPHIPRFSPASSEDIAVVDEIMAKTGTEQFRHRYMTELSGGERQRIVFARALAQNTQVLMLDEATSNLDIRHTLNLLNIVSDGVRKEGKTAIAVIQDINLAASYCDRMIFMKKGKAAAFGETDEVLTAETIQKVFNVDSVIYFEPYSASRKVAFKK